MTLSATYEEVWSEINSDSLFRRLDDPELEEEDLPNKLDSSKHDTDTDEYDEGSCFEEDLEDFLVVSQLPRRLQQQTFTQVYVDQEDVATALESAFNEALAHYTILDSSSELPNSSNNGIIGHIIRKKTKTKEEIEYYQQQVFPSEITNFWDGWFDELEIDEEINSLEDEIVSLEEEIARMQRHKKSLKSSPTSSPTSSPIATTIDLDFSYPLPLNYVEPLASASSLASEFHSAVNTVQTSKLQEKEEEPSSDSNYVVIDGDEDDELPVVTASKSLETTKPVETLIIEVVQKPKKRQALKKSATKQKKRKSSDEDDSEEDVITTKRSKSRRKLNFKKAEEVFKVEQVLKIKSVEEDCEDEDVDIGDFNDCVNN